MWVGDEAAECVEPLPLAPAQRDPVGELVRLVDGDQSGRAVVVEVGVVREDVNRFAERWHEPKPVGQLRFPLLDEVRQDQHRLVGRAVEYILSDNHSGFDRLFRVRPRRPTNTAEPSLATRRATSTWCGSRSIPGEISAVNPAHAALLDDRLHEAGPTPLPNRRLGDARRGRWSAREMEVRTA